MLDTRALLPPVALPPNTLPAGYRDPRHPTRDELGKMAYAASGERGPWRKLPETEKARYCTIGMAVFAAGMDYQEACVRARLEALQGE